MQREGERGGSSYNAPLVHCPEEVRKKARERDSGIEQEKRRIYCPLARSNLLHPSLSLSLIQVCSAPPSGPFVLVALCEEIKRETEKGKGQQKEEVRREERVVEEEKEGTEGRLGKRVPTCTIRYNLCQQF